MRHLCSIVFTLAVAAVTASAQPAQPAQAAKPTFDCAKATGQVETLICKDAGLIALDRKMAKVFAAANKTWPAADVKQQRVIQRGWIKGRNDCWKATDARACTEESYRQRIVELQIKSGQLMAPKPVEYACTGGEDKPFTVAFYKDTEPPSAVVTYGNDQVIAFSAPAASGSKYTATGMEFWEHQGEASVNFYDIKLTCKPRP